MRFVLAAAIVGALFVVADLVSDASLAAIRSGRNESTSKGRSDRLRRLTVEGSSNQRRKKRGLNFD